MATDGLISDADQPEPLFPVWNAFQRATKESPEIFPGMGSTGFPLVPPISSASAFEFTSQQLQSHHANPRASHRYRRDSSPNVRLLEKVFEALHPGFDAFTFSSGMAAVAAPLFHLVRGSQLLVQKEKYRKTKAISARLQSFGMEVVEFDSTQPLEALPSTRDDVVVFLELPSNPHLLISDVVALRKRVGSGARIVLDATFSGMANLRAGLLEQVDVVVYSLTKYVGGHNDLVGGLALAKPEISPEIYAIRSEFGSILDPHSAAMFCRSLESFDMRFWSQGRNASQVVSLLSDFQMRGLVESVYYPGEANNESEKNLRDEYLISGGGVVSFEAILAPEVLREHIEELQEFSQAPSFGSNKSLIEIPADMSYPGLTESELWAEGISNRLVRLSVGQGSTSRILSDIEFLVGA